MWNVYLFNFRFQTGSTGITLVRYIMFTLSSSIHQVTDEKNQSLPKYSNSCFKAIPLCELQTLQINAYRLLGPSPIMRSISLSKAPRSRDKIGLVRDNPKIEKGKNSDEKLLRETTHNYNQHNTIWKCKPKRRNIFYVCFPHNHELQQLTSHLVIKIHSLREACSH